jgi:hypothetical protein
LSHWQIYLESDVSNETLLEKSFEVSSIKFIDIPPSFLRLSENQPISLTSSFNSNTSDMESSSFIYPIRQFLLITVDKSCLLYTLGLC